MLEYQDQAVIEEDVFCDCGNETHRDPDCQKCTDDGPVGKRLVAFRLEAVPLKPQPKRIAPVSLQQRQTSKPPFAWRLKQALKLTLDGSLLIPLLAWVARRWGLMVAYSEVRGQVAHADGSMTNYGLLGRRVITSAGVNAVASAFDNTIEPEVFKYHGYGTGTGAESASDTALGTEFTTEYATDNTRPTGSQTHSTNTYVTVGTFSPDSGGTLAVTEHGIFSQAANSGGTLLDRTKFTAVNVVAGSDSLQTTYTLTLPSGG